MNDWLQQQLAGLDDADPPPIRRWNGKRLLGDDRQRPLRVGEALLIWIDGRHQTEMGALVRGLRRWVASVDPEGDSTAVTDGSQALAMAMDVGRAGTDVAGRRSAVVNAIAALVEAVAGESAVVWVVEYGGRLSAFEERLLWGVRQLGRDGRASEFWVSQGTALPEDAAVAVLDRGPLFEGQMKRWVQRGGVLKRLVERCDGDEQRLEALLSGVGPAVEHLWWHKLEAASREERQVLAVLGIAGQSLEVGFLSTVVGRRVTSHLRHLEKQGVVSTELHGGRVMVQIVPEALQEHLRVGLDAEEARRWHGRLAEVGARGGEVGASFVAEHALEADRDELAKIYGLRGARELMRHGRWQRAQELLVRLQEEGRLDPSDEREAMELRLRLALANEEWEKGLRWAGKLADGEGDQVGAKIALANCHRRLGNQGKARTIYRELWQHPEATRELKLAAGVGMSELDFERGDHEGVHRRMNVLKALDEDIGEVTKAGLDLISLGAKVAVFEGRLTAAEESFEKARQRATELGVQREVWRARINLGMVAVQKRRFREARQRLESVWEDGGRRLGGLEIACRLNLGIVAQRQGDYDDALTHYRTVVAEGRRRGDERAMRVATHNLATVYQDLGAFDQVERLLESSSDGEGFAHHWREMVRAQNAWGRGDWDEALWRLEAADRALDEQRKLYGKEMVLRRAMVHGCLGELEAARRLEMSVEATTPQEHSIAQWLDVYLRLKEGSSPDVDRWRDAIERLEDVGQRQDAMMARWQLIDGLKRRGDEGRARRWLQESVRRLENAAASIPSTYRDGFLRVYSHRQLLEEAGRSVPGAPTVPMATTAHGSMTSDALDRSSEAYRRWRQSFPTIVGQDRRLIDVLRVVERVSCGDHSVLITGESGTGKELIADAIHQRSERRDGPLIKVNCAAFVDDLLASELFGHEKGAFTGAVASREGRFERADGGTIFLDEIGDISPKTQVALLRVLQRGRFEKVGGEQARQVDVRVVAATHRDLEELVETGAFRLDLYYRLKGVCIELPALRERRQDIPALVAHFAEGFSENGEAPEFDEEVLQFLARYRWPGNIRELRHLVRSALVFCDEERVTMETMAYLRQFFGDSDMQQDLPPIDVGETSWTSPMVNDNKPVAKELEVGQTEDVLAEKVVSDGRCLSDLKKRLEKKCIQRALRQTGGNITHAAKILQMNRPRLSQIVNGDPELLELKKELVS